MNIKYVGGGFEHHFTGKNNEFTGVKISRRASTLRV